MKKKGERKETYLGKLRTGPGLDHEEKEISSFRRHRRCTREGEGVG